MTQPTSTPEAAPPIRLGLIGCGYVSKYHLAASRDLGVPITAVCDRKLEAADRCAHATGGRAFTDADALLDSGLVDAVIIATPHFSHLRLADAAIARGLHVLCEKPLTIAAGEARAFLARHRDRLTRDRIAFAVNFNQRTWRLWREVKRLIDHELGPLVRFQWTIGDWYRSQRYYDESNWRGTWAGEGGGLLVNQCPHQLDLLCWFFGLPQRLSATVRFGKHHRIETEDEVHALLDYGDVVGTFTASTGEPLGGHLLEIVGDRGVIRVRHRNHIDFTRYATGAADHTAHSPDRSSPPAHETITIDASDHRDEYRLILENFVAACRGESPPIASADDAVASLELANAILASGLEHRSVTLPIESDAFAQQLLNLQAGSRVRTGAASVGASVTTRGTV